MAGQVGGAVTGLSIRTDAEFTLHLADGSTRAVSCLEQTKRLSVRFLPRAAIAASFRP